VGEAALKAIEPGYPLAPHYVVHVGEDGSVLLPFTQAKQALDRLKRLCIGVTCLTREPALASTR